MSVRSALGRRGRLAAARRALRAPGLGMDLGGGTHHAGRDFARGSASSTTSSRRWSDCAPRARPAGARRRLRRPPGRRHRTDARAGPRRVRAFPARRTQLPVRADPLGPRHRPGDGHDRRRRTSRRCPTRWARHSRRGADIAFFLAGADPWEGDRLGRLALTKDGLRPATTRPRPPRRRARRSSSCSPAATRRTSRDTVDINAATVAAVAARDGVLKLTLFRGRSDNGSTRPLHGRGRGSIPSPPSTGPFRVRFGYAGGSGRDRRGDVAARLPPSTSTATASRRGRR